MSVNCIFGVLCEFEGQVLSSHLDSDQIDENWSEKTSDRILVNTEFPVEIKRSPDLQHELIRSRYESMKKLSGISMRFLGFSANLSAAKVELSISLTFALLDHEILTIAYQFGPTFFSDSHNHSLVNESIERFLSSSLEYEKN